MEALTSSWGAFSEKPKALFRRASKKDRREKELDMATVTPFPYVRATGSFFAIHNLIKSLDYSPISGQTNGQSDFFDADIPMVPRFSHIRHA